MILSYKSNKSVIIGSTNQSYNRYENILPYDDNIVELSDGKYINASWINNKEWIVTQGPLKKTCNTFWQMINEYNCNLIIMLCDCIEICCEKCYKYFPDVYNRFELNNPFIFVDCVDERIEGNIIYRKISLNGRIINHIQYLGWIDHGVPTNKEDIHKLVNIIYVMKLDKPFVIHCSAGIGRSGCLSAIYKSKISGEKDVDKIIKELREERKGMVQTQVQYDFCKEFIINPIKPQGRGHQGF